MRDVEFLPAWYPALRRRRKVVVLQAWIAGGLTLALLIWAGIGEHQVHSAQSGLTAVQRQLAQTDIELQRLSEIEAIKHELEAQDDVVRRLGTHVPAARLLQEIEGAMPPEMALLEFGLETQEQPKVLTAAAVAKGAEPAMDRKMKLRLVGVTPTDIEFGKFMENLVGIKYFSDVRPIIMRDRADHGHVMREFEVTFSLDLDGGGETVANTGN